MAGTEHHPTSLGIKPFEAISIVAVGIVYIALRFLFGFTEDHPIIIAIIGFGVALWAIMRPTEWAVEGLTMLAARLGIGTYAAGVLGSIMANLPELVLASLLIIRGESNIAILTVLVVAGANTLLFGIVTIRSSVSQGGHVSVPVTTLRYESELWS